MDIIYIYIYMYHVSLSVKSAFDRRTKSKLKFRNALCNIAENILHIHALWNINPLKPELNPICYLLALLGAHHFLHVSRIRVKLLTLR